MALFDILIKGNTLKAIKVKKEKEASIEGYSYVKTLVNSTKISALKQAKMQFNSGLIKLKSDIKEIKTTKEEINKMPTTKTHKTKKAIFCDFNGVLNDEELEKTVQFDESPCFMLPKIACPHKIFKLTKLAVDNNAEIVMTSMWRTQNVDYFGIIYRCINDSNIKEYIDYVEEHEELIQDLTLVMPTEDTGKRTDEIRNSILENEYTHYIVFEDEHYIEEDLNPIITNTRIGLLDEHVEKAYQLLK